MNKIVIGIDISKHKFDATYRSANQKWKDKVFENSSVGFENLLKWMSEHKIEKAHIVMEATGRYGEDLANFIFLGIMSVSLILLKSSIMVEAF